MQILGHSSSRITLDVYSHVTDDLADDAAWRWSEHCGARHDVIHDVIGVSAACIPVPQVRADRCEVASHYAAMLTGRLTGSVGVRGSTPLSSTLMTRPFPSGGAACVVSVSADQRDEQHDPAERDGCDRVAGGWPQERWPASSVRAPAVSDGGVKELG